MLVADPLIALDATLLAIQSRLDSGVFKPEEAELLRQAAIRNAFSSTTAAVTVVQPALPAPAAQDVHEAAESPSRGTAAAARLTCGFNIACL